MSHDVWATLGLARTSDRDEIRRAYARRLRATNPEDDPEGFKALRTAYDSALTQAVWGFDDDYDDDDQDDGRDTAVDAGAPPAASTITAVTFDATDWDTPVPEPAEIVVDPELDELQVRVDALAASVETAWGSDPALLDALLAAPAMERLSERDWVETWIARLIVDNVPKADTLIAPATAAFGWNARYSTNWAVNGVLDRARELSAPPRPRTGIFNRFSDFNFSAWRWWHWAIIGVLFANVLRDVVPALSDEPAPPTPVAQPAPRVPIAAAPAAEPSRRAPECPAEPAAVPGQARDPAPCSAQAEWLRFADFPEATLLAAGSRTLTARYEIERDGYISNCRLDPASGVPVVDRRVCSLLTKRAHYLPGRDAAGRAVRWEVSLGWGWTVTTTKAPPPPAASIPETPPTPAEAAPDEPGEPQ